LKHTQGKLEIAGATVLWSREAKEIVGAVGEPIQPVVRYQPVTASSENFEKAAANAERLKACWNACEGIPTEALEQSANVEQSRADKFFAAGRAIQERDELLAALRAWKSAADYGRTYAHLKDAQEDVAEAWQQAETLRDAALAKHAPKVANG
jgi:hypothetical protein